MDKGLRLTVAIVATLSVALASCTTIPKRVVRDSQTYIAEILAGLEREQAAADELAVAAAAARDAGDESACMAHYSVAHLIMVKAQPQAYRALWLGGLPYPLEDGSLPDPKQEQEDPGPAPALDTAAVNTFCGVDNE